MTHASFGFYWPSFYWTIVTPLLASSMLTAACGTNGESNDATPGVQSPTGGSDAMNPGTGDSNNAGAGETGSQNGGMGGLDGMTGGGGSVGITPEDPASTGGEGGEGVEAVPLTPNTCSSGDEIRSMAPPEKMLFNQLPIDEEFPFSVHWVGNSPEYEPRYLSQTALIDIDNDGDLDFVSGQRNAENQGGGGMSWFEYCGPDHWVPHFVGNGHRSAAGGGSMDVNGDGWMDIVSGDSWYENSKNPREDDEWQRHFIGAPESEELILVDVTGDDKPEALYVWRPHQPMFYRVGQDPRAEWEQVVLTPNPAYRQQQGGGAGDMDGDGDNDWVVGYRWWYRNVNGMGTEWEVVEIFGSERDDPYNEPLVYVGDLDNDGDNDFAIISHFKGDVAWAENVDGNGTEFRFHELKNDKQFLHTVVVADFNNDGNQDIFVGENSGAAYIYAGDGRGNFMEHTIAADVRMHEARVGDVDCDGDLDIVGKPWGDAPRNGEVAETRDHVYLKNELVENGGAPLFERSPYEEMHVMVGQKRICAPK
jgi:hypothetical protein